MDTEAKIMEIFEKAAKKCIALQSSINSNTNSYDFEKSFKKEMIRLEQTVYQEVVGRTDINKNERMKLMTGFGEIVLEKGHPLAVSPGGFNPFCSPSSNKPLYIVNIHFYEFRFVHYKFSFCKRLRFVF